MAGLGTLFVAVPVVMLGQRLADGLFGSEKDLDGLFDVAYRPPAPVGRRFVALRNGLLEDLRNRGVQARRPLQLNGLLEREEQLQRRWLLLVGRAMLELWAAGGAECNKPPLTRSNSD